MKKNLCIVLLVSLGVSYALRCSKSPLNLSPDAGGSYHIYVSPTGDNKYFGANPSQAVKNIYYAIELAKEHNNAPKIFIHLAEGMYSKESNGERFPLKPEKNTKIIGAGSGKTIIKGFKAQNQADAWDAAIFFILSENVQISRMTLLNAEYAVLLDFPAAFDTLSYLVLDNNKNGLIEVEASCFAKNVTVTNSELAMAVGSMQNCFLKNNKTALSTGGSFGSFKNSIIVGNQLGLSVGLGSFGHAGQIRAENLVIASNEIGLQCEGSVHETSVSEVINSIFWNNEQTVVTTCADTIPWNFKFKCGFRFSYCDLPDLAPLEQCEDRT